MPRKCVVIGRDYWLWHHPVDLLKKNKTRKQNLALLVCMLMMRSLCVSENNSIRLVPVPVMTRITQTTHRALVQPLYYRPDVKVKHHGFDFLFGNTDSILCLCRKKPLPNSRMIWRTGGGETYLPRLEGSLWGLLFLCNTHKYTHKSKTCKDIYVIFL